MTTEKSKEIDNIELTFDEKKAQQCVRDLFNAIGLKMYPELEETPRRIVDLYRDMMKGMDVDVNQFFARPLPTQHDQLIAFDGIEFVSMCEHHMWPFMGKAYIAYIPNGKIIGFSKFISAVRAVARRPQLQERMTTQLSDAIEKCLQPKGSMVVLKAQHSCMTIGGRYDWGFPAHTGTNSITSMCKGVFLNFEAPRNEVLSLWGINGGK
jgi:GTP cyclohydrolase I